MQSGDLEYANLVVAVSSGRHYDQFVGRPGPFGNPWSHLVLPGVILVDTVDEAVLRYASHVYTKPGLLEQVMMLRGKTLGCPGRCRLPACHAYVLARIANQPTRNSCTSSTRVRR